MQPKHVAINIISSWNIKNYRYVWDVSVRKLTLELTIDNVHLPDDVVLPVSNWSRSRVEPINLVIGSRQIILEPADFFLQPATNPAYASRLSSWANSTARLGRGYGIISYSRTLQILQGKFPSQPKTSHAHNLFWVRQSEDHIYKAKSYKRAFDYINIHIT